MRRRGRLAPARDADGIVTHQAAQGEAAGPGGARRGPGRVTLYVDTSALLKRYVDEPDSNDAERWLASDDELVTGWHTIVEVRRNSLVELARGPWPPPSPSRRECGPWPLCISGLHGAWVARSS